MAWGISPGLGGVNSVLPYLRNVDQRGRIYALEALTIFPAALISENDYLARFDRKSSELCTQKNQKI